MRALTVAVLSLLLPSAAAVIVLPPTTAVAQTNAGNADAMGSSLSELLAFATLGTVNTQEQAAQVTRSGADYLVRLPLKGFADPADAAVNAVAHPLDGGLWDITSMTFPSSGTVDRVTPGGTVGKAAPNAAVTRIAYSIGEQAIHARIDPSFTQPSTFAANLGAIVLRSDQGEQHGEQTFERYVMDGTLLAEPGGALDFMSRGSASNWHLTVHDRHGFDADSSVRKLSGHALVEGLNQAQGTRLLAAARAMLGAAATPGQPVGVGQTPGGPVRGLSAGQHEDLRALVDSLAGLLAKFQVEETFDGISFSAGPHASGTLGRVHFDLTGNAANERLGAQMDVAVDDLAVTSMTADTAAYVPRHVDIKSALSGVGTERLMALLRAAVGPTPDLDALQAAFTAMLGDPAAKVGIELLSFDSGPLRVTGSAHVVQRADGQLGADIHVSATGMDALIAQAQGKPALQRGVPMMFMAKGMGRPDGGALVWDIAVGDGPLTVNGTPFGQPAARTR